MVSKGNYPQMAAKNQVSEILYPDTDLGAPAGDNFRYISSIQCIQSTLKHLVFPVSFEPKRNGRPW